VSIFFSPFHPEVLYHRNKWPNYYYMCLARSQCILGCINSISRHGIPMSDGPYVSNSVQFKALYFSYNSRGITRKGSKIFLYSFQHWSAEDWKRVRQDHLETSFLVRNTDRIFSPIVLISYINNIFFVCMQLLSGLT
jgi:hypothetical protein